MIHSQLGVVFQAYKLPRSCDVTVDVQCLAVASGGYEHDAWTVICTISLASLRLYELSPYCRLVLVLRPLRVYDLTYSDICSHALA